MVDARNTARLLAVMQRDGFVVRLTKDRTESAAAAYAASVKGCGSGGGGGGGGVSSAASNAAASSNTAVGEKTKVVGVHRDPTPPFCNCMRRAKRATVQRYGR